MVKWIQVALVILSLVLLPLVSFADEVTLGLGAGWSTSPYKSHDDSIMPVPIIRYEGEYFFIRGLSAGVHIWQNETHAVSAGVSYAPQSFDSSKTDDSRMKKLDDRYSSINVDLRYMLRTEYGHAGAVLSREILGNGDGFSGEVWYAYPLQAGPVHIVPAAGLRWESEEQLEYYYGISRSESRKSGLDTYSPKDGVSPYLSLGANWEFTEHWSLAAHGRVLFLSDEIRDSPMVDSSQVFSGALGLQYDF